MARTQLILVPGILCDRAVWQPQLTALRDAADVQVYDPGALDSLVGMARDLLSAAPPSFALAAHSMGGRIALEVLRIAPQRVSAIALLDTGYAPLPAGEAAKQEAANRAAMLDLAHSEGMRATGLKWLPDIVHPSRLGDRDLIDTILTMFERSTPEIFAAQIQAMLTRPDGAPVLTAIKCPALVLCGREDAWSPVARHRQMAAMIAHSVFVEIPECGHMSTLERPDAVSQALRTWLPRCNEG